MKKKHTTRMLLLIVSVCCILCIPGAASAASGDPGLRFELSTPDSTSGLKAGDQVEVRVSVQREDGSQLPYSLASIMLDIDYDNDLFQVSQLKTCGLKRPDGQNWIGGWTCNTIPAGETSKRVRVLYLNMSGLMADPPKLDSVSEKLEAASFLLTAKKDSPDTESAVTFQFVENGDAQGNESPSTAGEPLTLHFAKTGGGDESGGSSTGGSGSDNSSGSGGGSGSGSGANSGSNSGSGSAAMPETGDESSSGDSQQGQSSAGSVRFSELTDVPADHWAAGYIEALVDKGVLSGNEEKQFEPEKPVTRAEFCQMIASAFRYTAKGTAAQFADVTPADWYFKPVMALYEAGIVSGVGDGLFGAEDTLSRQDMAVILYQVQKDRNIMRSVERNYAVFSDQIQIEDYARQALVDMYCTGLISGTSESTLSPLEHSTRAQAATVLYKMLEERERR